MDQRIRPWPDNPRYWQYHGAPVLLLGATSADNAFQMPDLDEQIDALVDAGGNYIRNTMSDRRDHGYEVYAYAQRSDGLYDLNDWNSEYWRRFEHMLQRTAELGVIVQLEMWDRFDFTDNKGANHWQNHPYRPANNVNYTAEESSLDDAYPDHPGQNKQPWFYTTPNQRNNRVLLHWQERFVAKVLDDSLRYDHVLYCIDNETKADEAWAIHWRDFLVNRAEAAGKRICVTEMWDDWELQADRHLRTFDHPERYDFVEVSQNNQRTGREHWDNLQWARQYLADAPRPMNMTKVYGADGGPHGDTRDGFERFWRSVIGGVASARFHRPPGGQGINDRSLASIRSVRLIESRVRFWQLEPADELLHRDDSNDAYAAARPGKACVVLFTRDTPVQLDLTAAPGKLRCDWIDVARGESSRQTTIDGGTTIALRPPGEGFHVVVLTSG